MGYTIEKHKISKSDAWFVQFDSPTNYPKLVATISPIKKYANFYRNKIIINAGLFNTFSQEPNGQVIIDKLTINDGIVEDDMGAKINNEECYPLVVDNNIMKILAPNRFSVLNSVENLKQYQYSVCGWGLVIYNGADAKLYEKEIRWGKAKKARQIVGYKKNNHPFILTCRNAKYIDIVNFLLENDVEFAYSLDGGRSTKLFIDGKQINSFTFGSKGRKYIPTLLEFDISER